MQTNENKKVDDLKEKEMQFKKAVRRLNYIIDSKFNLKTIRRDATWKT